MNQRIQIFGAVLVLLAALFGARPAAADSSFSVDVWGTADNLHQSSVIAITQTRDGYLWLGTLNGLARFDGNSFTWFNVNNMPGLPGNGIVFLYEDSRTNLWVGTDDGALCRICQGVLTRIHAGETGGGKFTAAFDDQTGTIWFVTDSQRIFTWRNGVFTAATAVDVALRRFLVYLAFHVLVPEPDGSSWQLENGQVEKIKGDRVEKNFGPLPWGWGAVIVTAAIEDGDGNLVVGTRGAGVFWFKPDGKYEHIGREDGLSGDYVLSLCFDSEKNLWVGTDGGGLDRVQKKKFHAPAALSPGAAESIAEDAAGGLWATFNLRGLTYWLTNSAQHFDIGAGNRGWAVLVDHRQQVWAGTSGEGLFHLAGGGFQPVAAAEKIGPQIFALFEGRDGKLWVGGQNGLGCFDGQNWSFFTAGEGLPPQAVCALAEAKNGDLWIGTAGGGLFQLHDGEIRAANAPAGDISCLLTDASDDLWVGTAGHGLARLAQGRWTTFAERDGLAGDDVGYLVEDGLGNLWIGSYEGLLRADEKSFDDLAAGTAKKIPGRILLTRECSVGAQPAAIRTRAGDLWFPTTEGLVSVNPADLKPDTNLPPVIIESVLVDGVDQKTNALAPVGNGPVTLTPANEQLEIHYTALNFSAPKGAQFGARFRYQLAGRDQKFTDVGDERVAHFSKLAPGSYVFNVMACNEDGVWNGTGASLAITVQPPFWRTPAFIVAATLAFLGVLAGVIYLASTAKLRRQLRALHQKEMIERERARIARDLHDQLGANLTQVTLLGEMAEADKHLPEEVESHAQQICETARETTRSLDEIVWAVNPQNDTLEGLVNYACKYAQDYFALAKVSYRAELPAQLPPTPILPEVRHNVFLAFKEAVNNVVKHARATEARVKLQLEPGRFILSVEDNGRGLGDVSEKKLRNGLKNMRKRLADVRGEFEIGPGVPGGTRVQLKVPIGPGNAN